MHFQAYLIKQNSSPLLNFSLIGIILFLLSIFCLAFPATESIGVIAAITGLLLVTISALLNRGKGLYEVTTEILYIDEEQIKIASSTYAMSSVSQLHFYYDSFYSQSSFGYFTEQTGLIEYGMNNRISFVNNNVEVSWRFYIATLEHANSYFALLEHLKNKGVYYSSECRPGRQP